jgi:exodeoxyribonuclease V alpha subunit
MARIKAKEEAQGWNYTERQLEGIFATMENNVTIITGYGGTGKTSAVTGMLACTDEGYDFKQCALSGKASANLTDVTGVEGTTIHSLLKYDGKLGEFMVNEHSPLETDLVILDEGSMVDMELALALLKAIPNGAKLIILGDTNQLESIGAGNLLMDLIDSEIVPTIVFDKVHRQGAKSAIKTESIKVAEGRQLTKTTWQGNEVLGELKDLKYIGFNHSKGSVRPTIDLVMTEFRQLYKEAKDIKDIAVILPTKASGSSCHAVNLLIQDYVLPKNKGVGITLGEDDKQFTIYKGDKIINLRNNRKAYNYENVDGSYKVEKVIKPIFNGNMGEVIDIINDETILVDFYNIGEVIIDSKQLEHIALGYAITVHKAQGSTIPYVIGAIDYTHYSMLNRQLVYTLMSRAKTKMSFVFESKALSKAISTNYVTNKRTFLYHLLVGEIE